MQAKVIGCGDHGMVIRVRRGYKNETLYMGKSQSPVGTGDVIEVKRVVNNPFPVFVRIITQALR